MNIDLKDIKILAILSQNSRLNYSQIGKKVQLSGDSVKARIDKLQESGVLKAFKVNIDYSSFGFIEYDIYFRLKNYDQKELKLIIDYLTNDDNVTWIATCFGKYDLRISIIVRESRDINLFIESFEKEFSKYFVDYLVVNVVEKYKMEQNKIISDLFNINPKTISSLYENRVISKKVQNEKIILDEVNREILKQLNKMPNNSLIEIAKKLKMTPEAIKYRINEMKKRGIIKSFSITIDGNKLNKIWAVFLFKLNSGNMKKFEKFIQSSQNISAFVKLLGNWNFSISVFANNVQEIHNVLMSFRNNFPDLIRDYEMILLFETYKYPQIPKIVLKK